MTRITFLPLDGESLIKKKKKKSKAICDQRPVLGLLLIFFIIIYCSLLITPFKSSTITCYFLATVIYYTTSYMTFPLHPTEVLIAYFLLKILSLYVRLFVNVMVCLNHLVRISLQNHNFYLFSTELCDLKSTVRLLPRARAL